MILVSLPMWVKAQPPLKFYDEMSDILQAVFCDYASKGEIKYISSPHGQFVGQLVNNVIYGWGHFLADDAQTFPGIFAQITQAGVEGCAAPAFQGPEANLIENLAGGKHIFQTHTGSSLRLMCVTEDGVSNIEFICHIAKEFLSVRISGMRRVRPITHRTGQGEHRRRSQNR